MFSMNKIPQKIAFLDAYGFTVGDRDPRLNTAFNGAHMVVDANHENIGDYALPTEDAIEGPWCVVGDDLNELIEDACYYVLGLALETNTIENDWEDMMLLSENDLPARKYLSLDAATAPSAPDLASARA